ncbi:MAG: DUF4169 family protein [Pseudomonadota bacterium]
MADIINLNKVRKLKMRTDAEKRAAENRIRFGRSKDEKQRERNETAEAARKLDGHKLDPPPSARD